MDQRKRKKTIKHSKKNVFFWSLFCYEHNFKCLPCFLLRLPFYPSLFISFPLSFVSSFLMFCLFFAFLFWGFSFLPLFFVFPYSYLVSLLFLLDMSLGACIFDLLCFLVFYEKNNFKIVNETGFFHQYLLRCGF